MSLGSASGCCAKLPLAKHPERSEGPDPLQWLGLDGDGVAHLALDGVYCLIHCRRLLVKTDSRDQGGVKGTRNLVEDSLDLGRGARPLQGGVGGKLISPHCPPLRGG